MIRIATAIGILCLSGTAYAETSAKAPTKTADEALQSTAATYVSANRKVSYTRDNLLRTFYTTDADGDGKVTEKDYLLLNQIDKANQRSYMMQKWSKMDLNGNGTVEKQEMNTVFLSQASRPIRHQGIQITPSRDQMALILEKLVQKASGSDLDNDGNITFEEALKSANRDVEQRNTRCRTFCKNRRIPASLDKNGDEAVDLEEFKAEVELVLQAVDINKDGHISNEEANNFRSHAYRLKRKLRR